MTFAIPMPQSVLERLLETREYFLLVRIHAGNSGLVDLLPTKVGCTCSSSSQSWQFTLKNRGEYSEGLWSGLKAEVFFGVDGENWSQVFSGYVSGEGLSRNYGRVTDDTVTLELEDRTRGKGTKRKPDSQAFAGFKISDPDDTANSLVHLFAGMMGVGTVNCGKIALKKDLVTVGEGTVWNELQSMREAYDAYLYFDHMGRLFFHTAQEVGWSEPESEWTLNGDPEYIPEGLYSPVVGSVDVTVEAPVCTRAKSSLKVYEHLEQRIIYRNTENSGQVGKDATCHIIVKAGSTWPEEGVASLKFKDPDTNDEYDYATDIVVPTIGRGKNFDIFSDGGNLQLVSFNGSTSATRPEAGAAQIQLKNTGFSDCTIKKFEIQGRPMKTVDGPKLEDKVADISEEDFIDVEVDGKYGIDKSQMERTLGALVGRGKSSHRLFQITTTYLPFVQRGMWMTLRLPRKAGQEQGESILAEVISYSHKQAGATLATMRTGLGLKEIVPYEPVYNTTVVSNRPNVTPPVKGEDGKPATFLTFGLSSLVFHYNGDGVLAPPNQTITATARGQNLVEDPVWMVNGTSFGTPGFSIEIPSTLMESRNFITVEVRSGDLFSSNVITRLTDGQEGRPGVDGSPGWSSAQVALYRRSTVPPVPYGGGSATYSFRTGTLAFGSGGSDGWSPAVTTGEGDLYVIYASASSQSSTDTISANEWTAPTLLLVEAVPGQDGANVATVFIYNASATVPSLPIGEVTYHFNGGMISGLTGGWSTDVPSGSTKVYVSTATVYSRTDSDIIQPSEWAAAQVFREKGEQGDAGVAATTVVLSNEAELIPSGADGSVSAGSFVCDVLGYVGATVMRPTSIISTASPLVMNVTQTDIIGGKRLTINYTAGTLGGADKGSITLTIVCNGLSFTKIVTWTKSKTGATGSTGDQGLPSVGYFITASQATYAMTSRALVKTQQTIVFTCDRQNTTGTITWSVNRNLTITPSSDRMTATVIIPVGFGYVNFTITCVVAGVGTKMFTVNGVASGSPEPMFLGILDSPPAITSEGPLMVGDSYLRTDNIPQRWDGVNWAKAQNSDSNYAQIMLDSANLIISSGIKVLPSTSALYGWFENLVGINAVFQNLIANSLTVGPGDGTVGSGFRFRAVPSYNTHGEPVSAVFDVMLGSQTVLKVEPSTGKIFFGQPDATATSPLSGFMYDPQNEGAIRMYNDNTVISADGKITAVNGEWKGNIANGVIETKKGDFVDGVNAYQIQENDIQQDVFARIKKANIDGYCDAGAFVRKLSSEDMSKGDVHRFSVLCSQTILVVNRYYLKAQNNIIVYTTDFESVLTIDTGLQPLGLCEVDGKCLALYPDMISPYATYSLYDVTGGEVRKLSSLQGKFGGSPTCRYLYYDSESGYLFIGGLAGYFGVYDCANNRIVLETNIVSGNIYCMSKMESVGFGNDIGLVVGGTNILSYILYDKKTNTCTAVPVLQDFSGTVNNIWDGKGVMIVCGTDFIIYYDIMGGAAIKKIQSGYIFLDCIPSSCDKRIYVVGTRGGNQSILFHFDKFLASFEGANFSDAQYVVDGKNLQHFISLTDGFLLFSTVDTTSSQVVKYSYAMKDDEIYKIQVQYKSDHLTMIFDDKYQAPVDIYENSLARCGFILNAQYAERLHVYKAMSFDSVDLNVDKNARVWGAVFN